MKKQGKKEIGFTILLILMALCYALYLEIYKNSLLGWGMMVVAFVTFWILRRKILREKKWYQKILSWILFFAVLVGISAVSKAPYQQIAAVEGKNIEKTDVVTVAQGDLTGVYTKDKEVEVYAGIPYAKPPVGELRWKEPVDPDKWEGVRVCDTFAPMSMQKESNPIWSTGSKIIGYHNFSISLKDNYKEAMSEDSLYLNVWRPAKDDKEKLPVLVYIHGGSLNSGQSYFPDYNGETLAKKGIIVVTITYRLGVFGYLASDELASESGHGTTGNYGLLDQIQALKWVNENIDEFGGDASNVTIAGESAGASSVNAICVSPLAKGLFRRAVAESSGITAVEPYHTFRTMEQAKEVGTNIMEEFDCSTMEELRKVPAEELVNTVYSNNEMTVDGYAIAEQPYLTYEKGNNNEEVVLGGYNSDEATVFRMFGEKVTVDTYQEKLEQVVGKENAPALLALYPVNSNEEANTSYNQILGRAWFGYSHYNWSKLLAAENRNAYLYYFSKENGALGPWHAGELPYMYGNLFRNAKNYDESDEALSEVMQRYLVNFVKTGDPNGEGLPLWSTYNDSSDKIMSFGDEIGMMENQDVSFFQVVDQYMDSLREE